MSYTMQPDITWITIITRKLFGAYVESLTRVARDLDEAMTLRVAEPE